MQKRTAVGATSAGPACHLPLTAASRAPDGGSVWSRMLRMAVNVIQKRAEDILNGLFTARKEEAFLSKII